jgi:hypothetical protein
MPVREEPFWVVVVICVGLWRGGNPVKTRPWKERPFAFILLLFYYSLSFILRSSFFAHITAGKKGDKKKKGGKKKGGKKGGKKVVPSPFYFYMAIVSSIYNSNVSTFPPPAYTYSHFRLIERSGKKERRQKRKGKEEEGTSWGKNRGA